MIAGVLAGVLTSGLLLVGCAAAPHATVAVPTAPSVLVRDEIAHAETAERTRRHDVAREHYQRAIARATDPVSTGYARHKYAETLISWGELPEAVAQLEGVVAARPGDAAAWHDLGMLKHTLRDDVGAIAALERARDLATSDVRPRIALAALRWKRGDLTGATTEYRALLALDLPDPLRDKITWALGELAKPAPAKP